MSVKEPAEIEIQFFIGINCVSSWKANPKTPPAESLSPINLKFQPLSPKPYRSLRLLVLKGE